MAESGQAAYNAGKRLSDNPFIYKSEQWYEWRNEWLMAQEIAEFLGTARVIDPQRI